MNIYFVTLVSSSSLEHQVKFSSTFLNERHSHLSLPFVLDSLGLQLGQLVLAVPRKIMQNILITKNIYKPRSKTLCDTGYEQGWVSEFVNKLLMNYRKYTNDFVIIESSNCHAGTYRRTRFALVSSFTRTPIYSLQDDINIKVNNRI